MPVGLMDGWVFCLILIKFIDDDFSRCGDEKSDRDEAFFVTSHLQFPAYRKKTIYILPASVSGIGSADCYNYRRGVWVLLYFEAIAKLFYVSERGTRREYWMIWFITLGAGISIAIWEAKYLPYRSYLGPVGEMYLLLIAVPYLSVTIRRLHDADFSGWWFFVILVPVVGPLIQLMLLASGGTRGPNSFGPDPREVRPIHLRHRWQK